MIKSNIETIGFSGMLVELNLGELIVLNDFIAEAKKELAENGKYNKTTAAMLTKACVVLGKFMPEDISMLSLTNARKNLFEVEEPELKADNEL